MTLGEYLDSKMPKLLVALRESGFEFRVIDLEIIVGSPNTWLFVQDKFDESEQSVRLRHLLSCFKFERLLSQPDYAHASYRESVNDFRIDVVHDSAMLERHLVVLKKNFSFPRSFDQRMQILSAMYLAVKDNTAA
jgi:hypothetical protein